MMVYSTKNREYVTTTNVVSMNKNDYKPVRINDRGTEELWVRTINGKVVEKKWKRINYKYRR